MVYVNYNVLGTCAAKAFYSCPAIISRRPGSQNTPKESQLNPANAPKTSISFKEANKRNVNVDIYGVSYIFFVQNLYSHGESV
jgi:hypothetical protein